jgi:uncharacterized protein
MHFDRVTKHHPAAFIGLAYLLLGLVACASNAAEPMQHTLPVVPVLVGTHKVNAELANTDTTRQIGLMNRTELAKNSGMLFVFSRSETQCMWMKNTLIDLDVAFADDNGTILNIAQMKAGTTDIHCSKGNARLALEMNLNWFSERNLSAGDTLLVPDRAMQFQ